MNQPPHKTLHLQLVQLRDQARDWAIGLPVDGFRAWAGICANLNDCDSRLKYTLLRDLVEAWPAGTGDRIFPVPHPDRTPGLGFTHSPPQEMWNPKFEYARNRWALLDWLIEQTKPNEGSQS